jgi:hypothetical protein
MVSIFLALMLSWKKIAENLMFSASSSSDQRKRTIKAEGQTRACSPNLTNKSTAILPLSKVPKKTTACKLRFFQGPVKYFFGKKTENRKKIQFFFSGP